MRHLFDFHGRNLSVVTGNFDIALIVGDGRYLFIESFPVNFHVEWQWVEYMGILETFALFVV